LYKRATVALARARISGFRRQPGPHAQNARQLLSPSASWVGQLGANLTTEQGKNAARAVAIDPMGTLHAAVGDLSQIKRIVKLMVLVNSTPTFSEQHLVANGASELFVEVFGDMGKHVRSAFGVAQIPFGSCVEIELVVEVRVVDFSELL
jgi:enamine deaminase RidA (YjgF/YER057c/UK114 family)